MSNRLDVRVLGVTIGTADGWDELDISKIQFYDFESSIPGIDSAECITVEFETGELTSYSQGNTPTSYDLFTILKSL